MGNFLVTIAPEQDSTDAELFQLGLRRMRQLKGQPLDSMVETNWARAAVFARQNGSGSPVANDEATGSWLLTAGTWFHSSGLTSGDDAKLLARAMDAGANKLAEELEGFFVIVFGDGRTREVFVITDIIGSRHCFLRRIDGCIVLSTSSLLLAGMGPAGPDKTGCEEFLRTGCIYEGRTLFDGVRKLPPATLLRLSGNAVAEEKNYWRVSDLDPEKFDGKQAVKQLTHQLLTAAARIGKLFARPVCDLTGGYDSRAVVAAFLSAGARFETTVAGAADSADVLIAEGLSNLTGKLHWHFESEPGTTFDRLQQALRLTDGECDLVDYARIQSLHEQLSQNFDASINGSFGELARGYWWELLWPRVGKREKLNARKIALRRYATEPESSQLFPPETSLNLVDHLGGVIERASAELSSGLNTLQMDNAYLRLRMQHWQGRIASSTDQIWPCLSPFMLRSVLEVMLQTGAQWRRNSLLMRMLLAELQPQLAAYPLEYGHPALPLNWKTWPRFLPAAKVYARKVCQRIGLTDELSKSEPPRMKLWRDEQVRELLRPETMRLGELIERRQLDGFLAASRQPQFLFEQQWQRLLSLEITLNFLHSEWK
ncbi:MAG TPA: hypothetical protein VGB07_19640 [Blastocatellia bacterium]